MYRFPLLLIAAILLAACTRPYATPAVEPAGEPFKGVLDLMKPETVPRARIIASHGMCSNLHLAAGADTHWVARRAGSIAGALGGFTRVADPATLTRRYDGDGDGIGVERYDALISTPDKLVEAVFLVWGRHVDRHRQDLEYDSLRRTTETPDEPERATINHELRARLMNQCLIDAVVYLGRNGDRLRADMRHAACDVLGGTYDAGSDTGAPGTEALCRFAGPLDETPVVLVPESLGSTILFDAFAALDDGEAERALRERLSRVASIFLVSNQLPLLSQANLSLAAPARPDAPAEDRVAEPDGVGRFFGLIGRPPVGLDPALERVLGRVELVAFSDPNDLLSYRLSNAFMDRYGHDGLRLWNVLVSNAPTVLGLVENPAPAHQGYERAQVFRMIAEGYDPATN